MENTERANWPTQKCRGLRVRSEEEIAREIRRAVEQEQRLVNRGSGRTPVDERKPRPAQPLPTRERQKPGVVIAAIVAVLGAGPLTVSEITARLPEFPPESVRGAIWRRKETFRKTAGIVRLRGVEEDGD